MSEFRGFPKIARLRRECIVSEKIDGSNAQIVIDLPSASTPMDKVIAKHPDTHLVMLAGSRTRYITPDDDNFGFAAWVAEHADELWTLGTGQHFGEWWGRGIQRNYGLAERRFSLFNTHRWQDGNPDRPACCGVVPVLYDGVFDTHEIDATLETLRVCGSSAAPGFDNPEGVVIYLTAPRVYLKRTIDKDDEPKGRDS